MKQQDNGRRTTSTNQDLSTRYFCFLDVPNNLVECGLSTGRTVNDAQADYAISNAHDWSQEVAEILCRSNFDFRDLLEELALEASLPQ